MDRRTFTKQTALAALALSYLPLGCKQPQSTTEKAMEPFVPFFKLSLAQWSLNQSIRNDGMDPFDFAAKAQELGFEGLEYVSGLYLPYLEKQTSMLDGLKSMQSILAAKATQHNQENLLIMVDGEGDLGIQAEAKRLEGVVNHHKWIDMAHALGCHSIRINLFGDGDKEAQQQASADSMRRLGEYAKDLNVNILVENHGGLSSDPDWVTGVMQMVNMPNVGTLPDFGNFCIEREGGERWGAPCVNEYPDAYEAIGKMMPYAKAVSAKSYAFDTEGNETKIDYYKMVKVVHDAGYKGYIGVEFEGGQPEVDGILATKNLLIKAAEKLSNDK